MIERPDSSSLALAAIAILGQAFWGRISPGLAWRRVASYRSHMRSGAEKRLADWAAVLSLAAVAFFAAPGFATDDSLRSVAAIPKGRMLGEPALGKGVFLVSARQLSDPNFSRTVVLLLAYDEHGAMGVVVNRPSALKIADAVKGIDGIGGRDDQLFVGGPVTQTQVTLLLRNSTRPLSSTHIFGEVYMSGSPETLQSAIDGDLSSDRFRAFAGYAGWGAGQLDSEVSRGDWFVLPGDPDILFSVDPATIWPLLIRGFSGRWALLAVSIRRADGAPPNRLAGDLDLGPPSRRIASVRSD